MADNIGSLLSNNPSSTFDGLQLQGRNLTIIDMRKNANVMLKHYDTAFKQIDVKIKKSYASILKEIDPEKYFDEMQKFRRLLSLQDSIAEQMIDLYKSSDQLILNNSLIASSNQYYRRQYALGWFAPRGGVILPFTIIDPAAVQLSVFSTKVKWDALKNIERKKKLQGLVPEGDRPTLRQLMRSNNKKAITAIKNTLTQGFIQGKGYSAMSKDLKKMFEGAKSNSMRILRTEGNRVMNGSDFLAYQDAKQNGMGGNREILSTLDVRTRAQSATVSGRKDNSEGFFTYPGGILVAYPGNSGVAKWDINDRETTITILDGVSGELRRGRNPLTGKNEIASYRGFNDWANKNGVVKNKFGQYVTTKKAADIAAKEAAEAIADPLSLLNIQKRTK